MGRKTSRKTSPTTNHNGLPRPTTTSTPEPVEKLDPQLAENVEKLAAETPSAPEIATLVVEPPANFDQQKLRELYNLAEKTRRIWESKNRELDTREGALKKREDDAEFKLMEADEDLAGRKKAADARDTELTRRERDLGVQADQIKKTQATLAEARAALDAREGAVAHLELDAKEGFKRLELQSRKEWEKALSELKAQRLQDHEAALDTMTRDQEARLKRQLDDANAKERVLETREAGLNEREVALAKKERRLELDRARVNASLEEREAERRRAREEGREESRRQLRDLEAALAEKDTRIRELTATIRGFGDLDAAALVARLDALKKERDELALELANRPSAVEAATLRALEPLNKDLESALAEERVKTAELSRRLTTYHQNKLELETQRNLVSSLEAQRKLLEDAIKELKNSYNLTVEGVKNKGAFAALQKLDLELATTRPTGQPPRTLAELCEDARMGMASAQRYGNDGPRYYTPEMVRSFVAGLAASRLHILQGLSGTGKTSLPIWFASALFGQDAKLRAECTAIVPVQSGWRDRTDLLGHYNAFERRFHESEFLQALYRAQTPAFADRPFFIVLDEMNLSHPEQYFADFLSALEQAENERIISLMESDIEGQSPKHLLEGRKIALPPNVWFIGTANQDETTKGVAPKTRDRAHIIDLSKVHDEFKVEPRPDRRVSFRDLEDLFKAARTTHQADHTSALKRLTELGPILEKAGIGLSSRLKRYLRDFVPVYVACGGRWLDALDHAVATKLLYGLQDRYEVKQSVLKELEDNLETTGWNATREQMRKVLP
ncbi:MAG TPA: hypothetical protein PK095_03165 [Myxococcota bacterium]|nr:hypothetical protein [Myxococcota bacterium]